MTTTIKITELTNIGANLASSTVIPVVNMAGTPTTEKTVLGNIANVVLAGAGGNYVSAAKATTATTANTVLTNAQPNITSMGNLTGLTVSNATGIVNFSNTANVTLGNVSNLHIAGGTAGQLLSTNGNGTLSWASDTTTYGNSNVVSLLSAFGSNTITTTGNVSVGNIIGNGQALTNIAGANVSGFVANANVSNTAFSVAGANVSGFVANANVSNTAFSVAAANVSGLGNIATINLTGSTSNVLYGNGVFASIPAGANTGNVTFSDQIVVGTGSNDGSGGLYLAPGNTSIASDAVQYLRVRGGDAPTHIHLDTGNNAYYDQYFGDDSKYVKLANIGNIVINSDDSIGNSAQWNFGVDGYLTVPGPITSPVDDTLTLVTSGSNGNSSSIGIDGEFGRTLLRTYDGTTLNTWEFDITGNLELPTNGSLNLTGGGVSQANGEDLLINASDNDGIVSSSILMSPGDTLTRVEQWSVQDSQSFTTADWSTGVYTIQAGQGAVTFTNAANIINFVNSLVGVGHIYFSVNGGPLLLWDGTSSGGGNITFYTPTLPATDPTVVTSFSYYYSYKSGFEIDYDVQEVNIYANDADISLQTTNNRDISLDSSGDVTITANSSSTWTFDTTGNLTVPGDLIGPAGANFTIYSNAAVHEFIFADDGTFYAPDNAVLGGNAIYIGPGANTLAGIEHEVFIASSNNFAYVQGVINNVSDNGSADWVALGAKGGDEGGQTSLGFTSSGFGDANYTITGNGDGYVLVQSYAPGQTLLGGGGNLILATGNQGTTKDIIFGTGGFLSSNIFGRISHSNNSLELSRTGATIKFTDSTVQNTAWTGSLARIANGNSNVNIATANGNIVITSSGTNGWNFDTTGNLTIPGSSGGFIKTIANASIGIAAIDNGTNNPAQLLSMTNAGAATSIVSAYSTNVAIQTNASGSINTWSFDNTGNLTLPTGGNISTTGNVTANNFIGNGSQLTNVATSTTGNWTLTPGVNTVNISVPINGTYSIWVRGNIPNGIVTYTATAVVTNTNVPVVGSSYGWYYEAGNALVLTSIPTQFVGTVNNISNAVIVTTTANVFTFGITNNSGNTAVVNYGYTKL